MGKQKFLIISLIVTAPKPNAVYASKYIIYYKPADRFAVLDNNIQ